MCVNQQTMVIFLSKVFKCALSFNQDGCRDFLGSLWHLFCGTPCFVWSNSPISVVLIGSTYANDKIWKTTGRFFVACARWSIKFEGSNCFLRKTGVNKNWHEHNYLGINLGQSNLCSSHQLAYLKEGARMKVMELLLPDDY